MTTKHTSESGQSILAEMAKIPVIIPGKLCERRDSGGKVTGWKLQRWREGRNETRYIPGDLIEKIREGTAGAQLFMKLAGDYVEAKGQEAMNTLTTSSDSKKKPTRQ